MHAQTNNLRTCIASHCDHSLGSICVRANYSDLLDLVGAQRQPSVVVLEQHDALACCVCSQPEALIRAYAGGVEGVVHWVPIEISQSEEHEVVVEQCFIDIALFDLS